METTFSKGIICHMFSERVVLTANTMTKQISIFKDGNKVNCIDASDMSISEYEQMLERTAKEADVLRKSSRVLRN